MHKFPIQIGIFVWECVSDFTLYAYTFPIL